MVPSFFEGPEKKLELAVVPGSRSLRSFGDDHWREIVTCADAQVLSILRSDDCDAYLLSESSLFVYDTFLTMITCGRTRLVNAARRILQDIPAEDVAVAIYERKNEHFPERQHTTFYDDVTALRGALDGRALRFGDEHDHHIHLFHTLGAHTPDPNDTTLEILMHGLPEETASCYVGATGALAHSTGLAAILPGFEIDEHAFTPAGYSMNALRGPDYATVHVTPEAVGSYVSFETNVDWRGQLPELVRQVIGVFRPASFDVVTFAPIDPSDAAAPELGLERHLLKDHVQTELAGYAVNFWHAFEPRGVRAPVVL